MFFILRLVLFPPDWNTMNSDNDDEANSQQTQWLSCPPGLSKKKKFSSVPVVKKTLVFFRKHFYVVLQQVTSQPTNKPR